MKKRGLKNRMTNDYNLTVDKAGIRLDKYIADQIEDLSRTRVGELIKLLSTIKKKKLLIRLL